MTEEIFIPEQNRTNVAVFEEEPGEKILNEIKKYVRDNKETHTWRGHSHTKPTKNSFIVILGEIEVPADKGVKAVAPCPCCCPDYPKFKFGIIAFFPEEKVIRLIGKDCYKTINEIAYNDALANYKIRKARQTLIKQIEPLRSNLPLEIEFAKTHLPIAEAVEEFRNDLKQTRLPQSVSRSGELTIERRVKKTKVNVDGSESEIFEPQRETLDKIEGREILQMTKERTDRSLKRFIDASQNLVSEMNNIGATSEMEDTDLREYSRNLINFRAMLEETFSLLKQRQKFLTSNARTQLVKWAKHPSCSTNIDIRATNSGITIDNKPLRAKSAATNTIPPLPKK